ncbi:PAS domain S-box protein [Umezakia ovalisporum]
MENTSDLIYTLTSNSIFTHHSPKITAILGYGLEEIVGHSITKFINLCR